MLFDIETFVEDADIFKKRLINAIAMTKGFNDYIEGLTKQQVVLEEPDAKLTYGPVKIHKKGKIKKW